MSPVSSLEAQTLTPAPPSIFQNSGGLADGLIFLGPDAGLLGPPPVSGPEILDNQGHIVWFSPVPSGYAGPDFRVQTYQGNPVLTWCQSANFGTINPSQTVDYIMDTHYNVVAKVTAGAGYNADQHEFELTPQGTALVPIYNTVQADLSSVGGSTTGYVTEGMVREVNVATGAIIFEWHSLAAGVALTESQVPCPATTTVDAPYDYFHINSIKLDTDGNLLISSRHTWTVYKVNRTTGAIMWRLGGTKSDFALGAGLPFRWQHDVECVDATTLRIFDNGTDGPPVPPYPYSRVIWVTHDDTTMTASVTRTIVHPDQLSVLAEGSAQTLDNGDTFVEWGILGRYSEFDPSGNLIYDASLPANYASYRGFRFAWAGEPTTSPTVSALQNTDGTIAVHAVWNGATQVVNWEVIGTNAAGASSVVVTGPWAGLDTEVTAPAGTVAVQVVALDGSGNSLGTSGTLAGPFVEAFPTQPQSQTIAAGSTVVFSASATGTSPVYHWTLNGNPLADGTFGGVTISGSAGPRLIVSGATSDYAGTYSLVATFLGTPVSSDEATLSVSETQDVGRLTNVSARALVGTGNNVLIAGYIVGGQGTSGLENLLIRASGPALGTLGVTGFLPDPELTLSLLGSTSSPRIVSGWDSNPAIAEAAASVGAFPWVDPMSLDSAYLHTFHIGQHSAVISGAGGDTGIALAEVYDATPAGTYTLTTPHLTNVSARAQVGTGANVLIAGFVIGGTTSKTVLIRASGPALNSFFSSGTLPDPELQLYSTSSGSSLMQANTGWGGDTQIAAEAALVGAFSWGTTATPDSAILVTLPPGSYTAEVLGASGDTGLSVVEVYEIP